MSVLGDSDLAQTGNQSMVAAPLATPLLKVRGLSAGYGLVPVVSAVDLHVQSGEIVALLGANGAGKSTTLLALAGEVPLSSGRVEWEGGPAPAKLWQLARLGLGYVPEGRSVFANMSLADNLRVAHGDPDAALAMFPELRLRLKVPGGLLSGGEQQMLALGRALSRQPKLLMADELSLGLAPQVVQRLMGAVRAAADEGAGVLIVEQHARVALKHADRAYVMQRGRIVFESTGSDAFRRLDEIEATYLSRTSIESGADSGYGGSTVVASE